QLREAFSSSHSELLTELGCRVVPTVVSPWMATASPQGRVYGVSARPCTPAQSRTDAPQAMAASAQAGAIPRSSQWAMIAPHPDATIHACIKALSEEWRHE